MIDGQKETSMGRIRATKRAVFSRASNHEASRRRLYRGLSGGLLTASMAASALAFGASSASATPSGGPWYVDPSGSGTACTQAAPCATISQALSTASAATTSGTIEVGAGTIEDVVSIPSGHWVIAGIPGSTTLTDPSPQSDTGFTNGAGTATISGIAITGFATGVWSDSAGATRLDQDNLSGNSINLLNDGTAGVDESTLSDASNLSVLTESGGSLTVDASSIVNSAGDGLDAYSGTLQVSNSTISDNGGSGLSVNGPSSAAIDSSTISGNGGNGVGDATAVSAFATILSDNTGGNCSGPLTDNGFNLDSGNTCGLESYLGSIVNSDPELGNLQDNGGPTETQAILPTSPAYAQVPASSCPATDQRGESRPQPAGSGFCDIGAFEYSLPTSIDITSPAMSGPTSAGANLGPVVVGAFDADGNPATSEHSIVLALSSTAGSSHFSLTEGGSSVSEVVIPSGSTTGGFFTGDSHPTSLPVTVQAAGLGTVSQTETVVTGPADTVSRTGGNNQQAAAGTNFPTALAVNVVDGTDNPVVGEPITFQVSSGSAGFGASGSSVTVDADSNGNAVAPTLVGGPTAGPVTVTAKSSVSGVDTSFSELVVPGPPASITVEAGNNQSTTPLTSFPSALEAIVQDSYGNVISGAQVDFAVTGGSASFPGPSSTDSELTASGLAVSQTLTAGPTAGPVTTTATVDGTSVTTSFTNQVVDHGPATDYTIANGDGQSVTPTQPFSDLQVQITDAEGNPVSGVSVQFTVQSGDASLGNGGAATTDSNGIADVPLTAGTEAGDVVVTAATSGFSDLTFDETVVPGPANSITVQTGSNQTAPPLTTFGNPLEVQVLDAWGNPITGDQVDFAITGGSASFPSAATTDSEASDSNGDATAAALSSLQTAGPVSVTATVDGTGVTTSFSGIAVVPGAPADFNATGGSGQQATPTAPFTDDLGIQITDAEGNPISNLPVTFSVTSGSASLSANGSQTTDSNGDAAVPLDAGTATGPVVVTASFSGLPDVTFDETVVPGPPAAISVGTGDNQQTTPNTAFPDALTGVVVDNWGNPVPGVQVDFAVTGGSASFPSSSATDSEITDGSGTATAAVLTGGPHAGPVTTTATVDGTSLSTTYTDQVVVHGPPTVFDLTGGNNQSATPTASFTDDPTVQITDAEGNPVSGVTVTFAVTEGSVTFPSGTTATTDQNGNASIPLDAGTTAGPVEITADAASLPTLTFDETVDPGPAASISVTGGSGQDTTPNTAFGNPLTAQVVDAWDNPVPGVQVDFDVTSGSASFPSSSATDSETTDGTGTATAAVLAAGPHAGPVTTTATVDATSLTTSFTDLVVVHGPAADFTITGGNDQSATPDGTFTSDPSIQITDAEGNPVSGVAVTFTVTSGSATLPSGGATTTDSNGDASVPLASGSTAGPVVVTAAATGLPTQTFDETVTPGAPTSLGATGGGQTTYGDTAFSQLLTGTVTDAEGNAVDGAPVSFTVSGPATFPGGASEKTVDTGTNGMATAPLLVASGVPGSVTVTVSSADTPTSTLVETVERAGAGDTMIAPTPDGKGHWTVSADGMVHNFGDARNYGSISRKLNQPIIGITSSSDGKGYWLIAADGGVFSFGDAHFYGSTGSRKLSSPIVGMAVLPGGTGYWLVSSGGKVFAFGHARRLPENGSEKATEPVVGIAATPDGGGYWIVTSAGSVLTFGDAHTFTANTTRKISSAVVGIAATPDGRGYWLATAAGGVFTYGNARQYHLVGTKRIASPVVGIASTPDGHGYWLVTSTQGAFGYGDAG
jgi:protocatechuate 3,4-dioxygenase beta subunit